MAVRSEKLFSLVKTGSAVPDGPTVRYTVPAGKTTIVKEIHVSSFSAAAPAVIVYAGDNVQRPIAFMELQLGVVAVRHDSMWVVMNPGDVLATFVDLVNAADIVWIAAYGAELAGVSS